MKKRLIKFKKQKAFTLIEIMAVVVIVSIGLVGTTQLVVQSLQAQTINRSTIIAHQLAQEGIELVRYIRDTNWEQGASHWNEGIDINAYCIDYRNPVLRPALDADDCKLYLSDSDWYIDPQTTAETNNPSRFRRRIITEVSNYPGLENESMLVTVEIDWYENNRRYDYVMGTELFNWR